MDIAVDGLLTLRAVLEHGTFEAAADALHVTPSAVSQRIKAMELSVGRVLVRRTKPITATHDGEILVRLAEQWMLLTAEAQLEFLGHRTGADIDDADTEHQRPVHLPIAANSDSLATWLLPALARMQREHPVVIEVIRADESQNSLLVKSGEALGAITSNPLALRGCHITPLGSMRYLPVATPGFIATWMPNGPTDIALSRAPMVSFDRDDHLQQQVLRAIMTEGSEPPTTYIPAASEHFRAVELGMGWGVLPTIHLDDALATGRLVRIADADVQIALFWQWWKLGSPLLTALTEAIVDAARTTLL